MTGRLRPSAAGVQTFRKRQFSSDGGSLSPLAARLQSRRAKLKRIKHARPGLKWRRGLETVRSRNIAGVWDTLEGRQAVALAAANTPICRVDFNKT